MVLKVDSRPSPWLTGPHAERTLSGGLLSTAIEIAQQAEVTLQTHVREQLLEVFTEFVRAEKTSVDLHKKLRKIQDAEIIIAQPQFTGLLEDVRDYFWIVCPFAVSGPRRRIVEFDYRQPIATNVPLDRLGMLAAVTAQPARIIKPNPEVTLDVDCLAAGEARTFHVDFEIPAQATATQAALRTTNNKYGKRELVTPATIHSRMVHVYYDQGGPIITGHMTATIRPDRTGTTQTLHALATLACVLIFVALFTVWTCSVSWINRLDRSSLTTALLLMPSLLATIVAGRPAHPLVSRMMLGLRITAILPTFALSIAVLLSIPEYGSAWSFRSIWTAAALTGTVAAARVLFEGRTMSKREGGHAYEQK